MILTCSLDAACLVSAVLFVIVVISMVSLFVFDGSALVGMLPVQVREHQLKHVRIPAHWLAFEIPLDVLPLSC